MEDSWLQNPSSFPSFPKTVRKAKLLLLQVDIIIDSCKSDYVFLILRWNRETSIWDSSKYFQPVVDCFSPHCFGKRACIFFSRSSSFVSTWCSQKISQSLDILIHCQGRGNVYCFWWWHVGSCPHSIIGEVVKLTFFFFFNE